MGGHFFQVLMEHPICSTGGVFEERVEYITMILCCKADADLRLSFWSFRRCMIL